MPTDSSSDSPESDRRAKAREVAEKRRQLREADEKDGQQVERGVMALLGEPPHFIRAEAHRVGDRRFRVNVRVGRSDEMELVCPQTRISHSFYVETDEAGDVLRTEPTIVPVC
jgi:hypothetical protein